MSVGGWAIGVVPLQLSSLKGIVRDPLFSLNSLPLGGPSSSLKTRREKRVTPFAAYPDENSLIHCCPPIRLPFAVFVFGVSSGPHFQTVQLAS